MTNDTSTLNGALTELGELLADNLVTMGVTDAQASDGLTTLANRILDIEQGGGGCVMVDLVTDKSIVSYYHTESATLTATVTVDGVLKSGESVQFYIDDVAWGSPVTTNASGVATKTYSANGTGDITIKAQCKYASKTCAIEDMFAYDDATTDKSNKFSFISNPTSSSISHQTDHYAVSYSRTPESNPVKINLAQFVCDGDFEASIDVYYTASSSRQWTWKVSGNDTFLYNNMSEIGAWSSSRILRTFEGTTSHGSNPSGTLPTSTWLTLKFKRENGNISLDVYNGSSHLNTYSSTGWTVSTNTIMGLQMSEYVSSFYFKNIKVKAL